MRSRRAVLSRLEEQNAALRRDRDQRAQLAAQQERGRIARDMHDIVAHSLSVIVVQADGASYAAGLDQMSTSPRGREALDTIATTAREALSETRRLVGVLRDAGQDTDYVPTAGLDGLPELLDRLRASGLDVSCAVSGQPRPIAREVDIAAYRFVQESLTNVLKHGGPGARARVLIEHGPVLRVSVTDDGRGAAADHDGEGNGIIGMRERAAAVGGALTAGPRPGGGFAVTARMVLDAQLEMVVVGEAGDEQAALDALGRTPAMLAYETGLVRVRPRS